MAGTRTVFAIAAVALVASLATACGSSSSSSSSGSSKSESSSSSAAPSPSASSTALSPADQVTALLAGKVDFKQPPGPVTPGTHKVAVIAAGLASSGPATLAKSAAEAIAKIGWTADAPGDGKFTPTTQASLIEKAVLDKVDGIILIAITPAAVTASISAAAAANIPIVCALCGPDLPAGIVNVTNDSAAAGDAQAVYAVSVTKPGSTIVVYQNTEFKASEQQTAETAKRVKELCPTCTVDTPSLLLAQASAPNAPIFTSLLTKYPEGKLGAVIVPFDTPAGALSNTALQLGRTDFAVVGFGALAPFIDMVGTGKPVVAKADVLISTPYYGWVSVDQLARSIAKSPNWDTKGLPVALVDMSTYSRYTAGNIFLVPTYDYKSVLAKDWGK
jgi:ABC-type sugar transport system substrate-binding protein